MQTPRSVIPLFMLALVLLSSTVASAAPTLVSPSPNSIGEIEKLTLDNPADVYSGGVMVAGGTQMILPKNLLIDLPANRLSLQQIFDQAPAACKALGESGLAKTDKCNGSGSGAIATLSAVRTNAGNVIVGDLFIQKAAESVTGVVTYINYDQGYYRVNGLPGDSATGAMVRLNDPGSRHTIQNGAGCAGGPNCSPDPRFTLDPDNYTNTFATGYPLCIPSTVSRSFTNPFGTATTTSRADANGVGDFLCPDTNRSSALNEPPVADSRLFAPVKVGDSVLAEGNFETVNGVRFLSAHSSVVQKALSTRNAPGQPDYLFLEEVGYEAPPYQNERLIALLIGFTTLAPTDVDVWSLHRDPVNNEAHEFPFASVQGCDNASGGPGECSSQGLVAAGQNIFKIRYDVDFVKGPEPKLSPCAHLLASRFASSHPGICSGGATTAKDIAVMSPVPHEIIARTGRKITSPEGSLITVDINGNPATNGEYLFPLGLNLGGLGVAEMSEVNINELYTPVPFEGIPWNLDRRLGPAGCLNDGGCEGLGSDPIGSFALDPFPYSGLDPRLQAAGLPNVSYTDPVFSPATLSSSRNRMFSYVNGSGRFDGNATVLPYVFGSFPADPPLISIAATPVLNIFPPITNEDAVSTDAGVPALINVLQNDFAVLGTIDPASVSITAAPVSGIVQVNANGTILFTPAEGFTGTANFSYTVASSFGAVSQPGQVSVAVAAVGPANPVQAGNDTASTPEDTAAVIDVIANDSTTEGTLAPNSVTIVTEPANGSAVPTGDGRVTYTPNPNFSGSNTFSYTVGNGSSVSVPATVTVAVTPVNDAPTAANDVATAAAGTPVTINLLANDSDPEGNPLTVTILSPPANGTATVNAGGTVTFTSNAVGTNTFTYTVSDNSGAQSEPATVSVTVTGLSSETVSILRAQYRSSTREWRIDGAVTNPVSSSVVVHIGRDLTGPVLGSATVVNGAWSVRVQGAGTNPVPDASNTVSAQGVSGGGSRLAFPLALR